MQKQKFEIQKPKNESEKQFKKFKSSYNTYFTTEEVNIEEIETDVRQIIENTLFDYREQIVQYQIRDKSIQTDINLITDKLDILSTYCKENKEKLPCLNLYQYFQILKTLNSQRLGLNTANQSVATKIIQKVVQVAKFGAGFVSIAGAIKNLTDVNLKEINNFINEIKQIAQQLTSESSTGAINIGLIHIQTIILRIQQIIYRLTQNDSLLEIIFYLEESVNVTNNDTLLFIYMQLNYLLSKQQIKDNFQELSVRLQELNKRELIFQQANLLQEKEYSESIIDKLKNIANLIAQSSQFRYIKAQLLLQFAKILSLSNQNSFYDIMISIVSNYLQEKQKSVKIIFEGNQIMADFIHNYLDKSKVLTQMNQFKNQMTKHLDDKQQYNEFAYDIQNENDLDKELDKYLVLMWEQSVKQRQQNLLTTHKDDALLVAINLCVNQQITYQEGYKINTQQEKDALKQIINQFLIPNFKLPPGESKK
ncbi:hypothetical protein ABPG72_020545, partial [Tetrahymena utriculariae]